MLRAALVLVAACGFSGPRVGDGHGDAPPASGLDAAFVTTDVQALADATLDQTFPDIPNDTTTLRVDGPSDGSVTLIRFDLAAINAMVASAELHIWTDTDKSDDPIDVYAMLETWDESSASWNRSPGHQFWNGAAPPARSTMSLARFTPSDMQTEYVVPISTAAVATWVATPSINFGLALAMTQTDGATFHSSEFTTVTKRPFLRVVHAP